MTIRVTAATHTGLIRQKNDDFYGATELVASEADGEVVSTQISGPGCLAIVADGLGGHPCGEYASRIAIQSVLASEPTTADELVEAFHRANRAVYVEMATQVECLRMGATASAALINEKGIAVVNVGDSSVFEMIDQRLVELTTPDLAATARQLPGLPESGLVQTLGGRSETASISPHVYVDDFRAEPRRLLLSTDGLTGYVTSDLIAETLREKDGAAAVEQLLDLALQSGGRDNVTVALVETV